jgi:cysteine desulfurase/selenocysteine lyase
MHQNITRKLMQTFIAYTLSQLATDAYEISRGKIQITSMPNFSHEVLIITLNQFGIHLSNGFSLFKTW